MIHCMLCEFDCDHNNFHLFEFEINEMSNYDT